MSVRSSSSALGLRFAVEELEPRVTPADVSFVTPAAAAAGPVSVRFEWGAGGAAFRNEIGYYAVDDGAGRVNGLLPSDAGYAQAALARGRTVFASGQGIGSRVDLTVEGDRRIGLYLVANGTTAAARAGQATAFFSFAAANPDGLAHVIGRARGDGGTDFRFEDQLGGGDGDFNDAVIAVKTGSGVLPPGQAGQTTPATFTLLERNGSPRGEFGVFQVNDASGRIGDLRPGDPDYARVALTSSARQTVFPVFSAAGTTATVTLLSGQFYGFYYIAGGPAQQLLFSDPNNTGSHLLRAYFSFVDANPDKIDHLDWRSPDTFGIEDSFGGGEGRGQDFNDAVIKFGFGAPTGTPTPPESETPGEEPIAPVPPPPAPTPVPPPPPAPTPPPPPAPASDTTPPTTTFRLTNDTGSSNADRITNDLQTVVTVTDTSRITALRAGYDTTDTSQFVNILPNLAANGTVTITPTLAQQINRGNPLANGPRTLRVQATDAAGNTGVTAFAFTLDTVAPPAPTFDLTTATDSGPDGDLRTDFATVSFVGGAQAGATVQLSRTAAPNVPGTGAIIAQTTVGAGNTFTFNGVALNVGPNSFVVRAVDVAGNASTRTQTFARNAPPTVANPIAAQNAAAGGGALTFNLANTFADAERVLRLVTAFPTGQAANLDVHLFATQTPATVANLLQYVNSGTPAQDFNGSVFHRLDKDFVLQGGGFSFDPNGTNTATTFPNIPEFAAVNNEPGVSNSRGTLAMAKLGGNPNSATSEFFFNLGDNSTNLDTQNGGFTVFGQVMNGGLQVLDTIEASVNEFNGPGLPGAAPFPLRAGADTTNFPLNVTANDLVSVTTASELTAVQRMTFTASSSATNVATVAVVNGTLTVTPQTAGAAVITVTATDLDGSQTTTTFTVTVNP